MTEPCLNVVFMIEIIIVIMLWLIIIIGIHIFLVRMYSFFGGKLLFEHRRNKIFYLILKTIIINLFIMVIINSNTLIYL